MSADDHTAVIRGKVHRIDYSRPGVDVLSTPVQIVDTRHIGKMMTSALNSLSRNMAVTHGMGGLT